MADGEIRGSRWRVQYGEIADREQFRIGYIGSEAWDAYFPIASLADVTAVLQGAVALSPGQFSRGTNYQTEKVNDWQQTVSIEPLSYTPTPPLMSLYSADLAELISLLQSLATELSDMEPNDWDDSSPKPLSEEQLPEYLHSDVLTSFLLSFSTEIVGALYVKADGVTNDTAGLLTAISVAMSAGKTLRLPPGVIMTDYVNLLPTGNVAIRGSGMGSTVVRLRPESPSPRGLFQFRNGTAYRVELSDLTLDGNNVALSGDSYTATLRLENRGNGKTLVRDVEIKNSPARGVANYLSGGEIRNCWVHDIAGEGITLEGRSGLTAIVDNVVEDTGNNGIRIGTPAGTVFSGLLVKVTGNQIRNIRADLGGTGEYGNGILVYRVDDVMVSGNTTNNTAWAGIRLSRADRAVIADNVIVSVQNQAAIFVEFEASYCSITGNQVSLSSNGIVVTNANNGAFECVITGNVVSTSGNSAISCETGIVADNVIDCNGTGTWAVKQIPAGVSAVSQMTVRGNHISGAKYGVGIPNNNGGATSFTEVVHNRMVRKDGNYASLLGALGTGTTPSDLGNGSFIGATYAAKVYLEQPNENVLSGEQPPAAVPGSRLSIAGVMRTWNGTAWA